MFTGLIEETGRVRSLQPLSEGNQLRIVAPRIASSLRTGDSVAVNGCCLTIVEIHSEEMVFDLLGETLARTNLGHLQAGSLVNLERALLADGRLGGHFVQGHIDTTVEVRDFSGAGADHRLELEMRPEFARYLAPKGSIALDGMSLTIAELRPDSFVVWIIPHTFRETNLHRLQPGDRINVEFDILAKYVERMLSLERQL